MGSDIKVKPCDQHVKNEHMPINYLCGGEERVKKNQYVKKKKKEFVQ